MKYENYGDVNFWDTGVLIMPTENEHEYHIITCDCDNDEENNYLFRTATINIDEIDKETLHDICAYAGDRDLSIDYTEEEYKLLACDAINYGYKPYDCEEGWYTKNKIIDFIDKYYINDIPWEYYKDNFYENRNVVVDIRNNYNQGGISIYDSLEDALEDFKSKAEIGWSITIVDK